MSEAPAAAAADPAPAPAPAPAPEAPAAPAAEAAPPAPPAPEAAEPSAPGDTLDSLRAQLAQSLAQNEALTAALDETSKQASAAMTAVDELRSEALGARREAKLAAIGLPAEFHALAPGGDPADPKVAAAFEAFRADPKFARLFTGTARTNTDLDIDHDALDKRLKAGENPFTSRSKRVSNWQRIKRGEVM